ncbi:hypothetical protein [Streptomyces sp. NPDC052114]|uniref:hypothetical protein n=1 Tax=unclassified Streptomyces TaxID=2593676 RepID=UPI00343B8B0A
MTSGGHGPYRPPWPPNGGPHPYRPPRAPLWRRLRDGDWPPTRELLRQAGPRRGCLAAPLLCCAWPLFFLVLTYPLARSARIRAHAMFPPDGHQRLQDPQVLRVQQVRAWIALAASLLILLAYGTSEDWSEMQEQFVFRLVLTPWLLLLTAPLVLVLLFRLASAPRRAAMRAGLRTTVRAVLCYFGAFTAVPLLALAATYFGRDTNAGVLTPLVMPTLLLPALWMLFFVAFSSATVVRTAFSTTRVHAALPALLAGLLVWELAGINLAVSGPPPGPPLIQLGALVAGPLSVSAVAWWEIDRLRTRHGVGLRG